MGLLHPWPTLLMCSPGVEGWRIDIIAPSMTSAPPLGKNPGLAGEKASITICELYDGEHREEEKGCE